MYALRDASIPSLHRSLKPLTIDEVMELTHLSEHTPLCIQSFNPMSLKWFRKMRPNIIRGLISYSYPVEDVKLSASTRYLLRNLLLSPLCSPHYIAYDYQDLGRHRLKHLHRLRAKGRPLLVWTVRSEEAETLALARADNFIFEEMTPRNLPNHEE